MINSTEFTKRLNKILKYYDLSAASFADRMNVGRSSISHILSGRNKPSLDFVMKVVSSYPEVELNWLVNGKGSFPRNQKVAPPPDQNIQANPQTDDRETKKPRKFAIKKIVLFYENGTFEVFEG